MAVDLSKDQLYNFVIVKSSTVTLGFDHAPSKNAAGMILKYGTGSRDAAGNDDYEGKVQGGSLYYLSGSEWHKAAHATAELAGIQKVNYGGIDQYIPDGIAGSGHGQGYPQLLAMALGTPNEYDGTAEEVGMLLRGVVTGFVPDPGYNRGPGGPIYGAATAGGANAGGYITMHTGSLASTKNVRRVIGHCIDCLDKDENGNCTNTSKLLIYFNPTTAYTILP